MALGMFALNSENGVRNKEKAQALAHAPQLHSLLRFLFARRAMMERPAPCSASSSLLRCKTRATMARPDVRQFSQAFKMPRYQDFHCNVSMCGGKSSHTFADRYARTGRPRRQLSGKPDQIIVHRMAGDSHCDGNVAPRIVGAGACRERPGLFDRGRLCKRSRRRA